jgi:hypothetical protein
MAVRRSTEPEPANAGMRVVGNPWPAVVVSISAQLQHPIATYLASRMGKIGADRLILKGYISTAV